MKLVKKILLSIIALVITTPLILWCLTKAIKPEAIKSIISNEILALTSKNSRIDGDVTWQLFPRPGIKITTIKMGNEPTNQDYSVTIDNLFVNLQLTSLLRGKLVFSELKVDGFEININSEAKSWGATTSQVGVQAENSTQIIDNTTAQFFIDNILLTHGKIQITGQHPIVLTGVQIGASQLNFQTHFPIQIKGELATSISENPLTANLNFKGRTRLPSLIFDKPLFQIIQSIALEGQISVQDLQYDRLKISKVNANVMTQADELILNPLNSSLYKGESVGDLSFDFSSKKLSFNQTATSLNASALFKDLFGKHVLKGSLDCSIHATTTLHNDDWKTHLRGNGSLTVKEGAFYFVDLAKLVDDLTNKTQFLMQEKTDKPLSVADENSAVAYQQGKTKFQLFSIQYRLQQPLVLDDSLLLQTENLQLKGTGQINLRDNTINNELSAKLLSSDQLLTDIQKLLDSTIPFKLSGSLSHPEVSVDDKKLTPAFSKYLVKKTLEKPVKQLDTTLKKLLAELS